MRMLSTIYSTLSKHKGKCLILIVAICVIVVVYYDPDDEEIILYKNNPFVTMFSPEIREKALDIYKRIPGTFQKYVDLTSTLKKFECSRHDFTIQIYGGSCDSLHDYIRQSLRQNFHENQVTKSNPDKIARKIVANCRQKDENWGKDDTSSTIFQFITRNVLKNSKETIYVEADVDADLSLECQNSFFFSFLSLFFRQNWLLSLFSFFCRRTCQADYDLTIELKKISMNSSKISQLQQIISNNNVEQAIKLIEKDITLSWDDLDDSKANPSWDDL